MIGRMVRKPFVSTPYNVDVYRPGATSTDRFGNVVPGAGDWCPTPVAQWWVHRTEEKGDESVLRTVDLMTAHFPAGEEPSPGGKVRLPDGSVWEAEGHAENYEHGFHGWSPGLVVVHCKRVEG